MRNAENSSKSFSNGDNAMMQTNTNEGRKFEKTFK